VNARLILAALFAAAIVLVSLEFAMGAADAGEVHLQNPCRARTFPGSGIGATVQRVFLNGLDGAACRLHTTREELVLSLGGSSAVLPRRWDEHTVEVALRAGLLRSVDEAVQRGDVPGFLGPPLQSLVRRLPLDRIVQGGFSLSDLLG
jgi:hypothetical protein